jgi:hypothetical protein
VTRNYQFQQAFKVLVRSNFCTQVLLSVRRKN